jgi:hypothetical protein
MADLRYVIPNQLRRRANRIRTLVLSLGVPGTLTLGFIHPVLALPAVIALCAVWDRQHRFLKGAEGEDLALGAPVVQPGSLSTLPNDYIVFNQLRIPWRDTSAELDYVVVGPNGIFNVECKHWAGEISGSDTDRAWIRRKPVSGRLHTTRQMRSPLHQVRRSTHALATYLRSMGINTWVEAVTVFTHPAATLSVRTDSVPVLTLPQLAPHIETYRPLIPFRHQAAAMRTIKLLLDEKRRAYTKRSAPATDAVGGTDGPRHITYFMRDFVTERVEAFMSHDLRKAIKNAAPEHDRPLDPVFAPLKPSAPESRAAGNTRPKIAKAARLTVIPGGASGAARHRTTVRTYLRCIETTKTEETSVVEEF